MLMTGLFTSPTISLNEVSLRSASQVGPAREGANAQSVTIVGQYWHSFAHMLRWCAIHDRAAAGLELPGAVAGGHHEGVSAEPRHGRLERGERAQATG